MLLAVFVLLLALILMTWVIIGNVVNYLTRFSNIMLLIAFSLGVTGLVVGIVTIIVACIKGSSL
jgi:hypothetical protein